MRLDDLRRAFVAVVPTDPHGWDDLWSAFVAIIREPLDEPGILYDSVAVEVVPAHPPYSERDGAVLSRRVGLPGSGEGNEFEAALFVSAEWDHVNGDVELSEFAGSGPSTYEHDPAPPVHEFIAQVESSPAVAQLRNSDDGFARWRVDYQPPEELD